MKSSSDMSVWRVPRALQQLVSIDRRGSKCWKQGQNCWYTLICRTAAAARIESNRSGPISSDSCLPISPLLSMICSWASQHWQALCRLFAALWCFCFKMQFSSLLFANCRLLFLFLLPFLPFPFSFYCAHWHPSNSVAAVSSGHPILHTCCCW